MTTQYVFKDYLTAHQQALCQVYFAHVLNPVEDSAKVVAKLCADHDISPEQLSDLVNHVQMYDRSIQCEFCGRYYKISPPYQSRPTERYCCDDCELFIVIPF